MRHYRHPLLVIHYDCHHFHLFIHGRPLFVYAFTIYIDSLVCSSLMDPFPRLFIDGKRRLRENQKQRVRSKIIFQKLARQRSLGNGHDD